MRAHFLLQFMDYMSNQGPVNDVLEIRDSQVTVNGQTFVNLANVPFAGNNEEYNLLLKNIKKTKKLLSVCEPQDPEYSEYAKELQELEKKLAHMEESLWDTALMITKLRSSRQSERLQRAMDLFNSGDNKGAMAVLREEDIDRDVKHNLHLIELGEEGKKGLRTNINEYKLRIKTLKNDMAEGWGEEVLALHEKILELADKAYGEDSLDVATYQTEASLDYSLLGKHQEALEIEEKALKTRLKVLGEANLDVALSYHNIGAEYSELGNYRKTLEYEENTLRILLTLLGEHQNGPEVASSYNNIGAAYGQLGDHEKAVKYGEKALRIQLVTLGENHPDVATSYNNVGSAYSKLGEHQKALVFLEKASLIWRSIWGENHRLVAISYDNMNCEFGELGDLKRAIEYEKKALGIWRYVLGENHPRVAETYISIAYKYEELEDYLKGLVYCTKGLKIAQSIKNAFIEACAQDGMGDIYMEMDHTEQAREHFQHAADLFNELGKEEEYEAVMDRIRSLPSKNNS